MTTKVTDVAYGAQDGGRKRKSSRKRTSRGGVYLTGNPQITFGGRKRKSSRKRTSRGGR